MKCKPQCQLCWHGLAHSTARRVAERETRLPPQAETMRIGGVHRPAGRVERKAVKVERRSLLRAIPLLPGEEPFRPDDGEDW